MNIQWFFQFFQPSAKSRTITLPVRPEPSVTNANWRDFVPTNWIGNTTGVITPMDEECLRA